MKNVRLGIVGLGNIGKFHTGYLLENKISRCTLTAVSDAFAPGLKPFEGRPGLKTFANCSEMIRSGEIDAIVIATPHFLHTTIGIEALQAGLHIMVEKPISAHKADAERLIATAQAHPKQVFGGMFQMRVEPRYQKIRKLIQDGELGEIVRINWIITDWFRTEAYYASGGWRATWKGEGGGVLLNQCLHQLDMLQWLCGMPARVRGFCQLGRFHATIYGEDELIETIAHELAEGKLIGWVQGRAEFGPRALGNRSILADPRHVGVKDKINSLIKFREEFRPFAPSVLHELGPSYFQGYQYTPYMDRTLKFSDPAAAPGVVHIDGTGRLQSVTKELNPLYHALIKRFHELTGVPMLLNTSFNVMGRPIIHDVEDAIGVFLTSGMDILVLSNHVFRKPHE